MRPGRYATKLQFLETESISRTSIQFLTHVQRYIKTAPMLNNKTFAKRGFSFCNYYAFVSRNFVCLVINCSVAQFMNIVSEITFFPTSRKIRSYRSRSKEHLPENSIANEASRALNIFLTENSTRVTAQIGGTARLPCEVRKSNNVVVSVFCL